MGNFVNEILRPGKVSSTKRPSDFVDEIIERTDFVDETDFRMHSPVHPDGVGAGTQGDGRYTVGQRRAVAVHQQMSKSKNESRRFGPPVRSSSHDPLLRVLFARAESRGDNMTELAHHLGVSYERVAQWRRGEGQMKTARREVHQRAAKYLGVPVVLVLVLVGAIGLDDFTWPAEESLEVQLEQELRKLRIDPFLGAFVPASLDSASMPLKLFVAMMYREIHSDPAADERGRKWFTSLHQAVAANQLGAEYGTDEGSSKAMF